ncbi:MAG: protein kinase domain-containing protein [Pseudomonadota bacterium]
MSQFSTTIPGYELIRELGSGGMATVYLAIQRSLDRKVALKIMKRNIDDIEKFEKRFLVEGRTMAKLPHRNIVSVYDIVKSDDATYIAMEYLEGGTLSQKMKDGLSLGDAISVVVQIAQALQFAHEHGVVHRDLKPANIMYRDAHTPVLTDFGIAKQQDATATRLTQTGMLVGTPTYMSPEQINALEVDGRSDLYALGVLFYELLTGAPPFTGDTPIAVLMAHLTQPPPPLPAQFIDFQPVLDRMLAKSRDERFASLKDFTRALKGAVVNNQMLWQRLQADPDQSSSEQLRALGFSISGGGDSLQVQVSQQVRLPPSGRGGARTPTPTPAPVSGGQAPAPRPARQLPWIAIAAAAAIAAGIGLGVFALLPAGGLDPDVQRRADIAIAQVRDAVRVDDLDKARGLLDLVPSEAGEYLATIAARREVVAAYKQRANTALGKRDLATATTAVLTAQTIDERDPELGAIVERIAAERKAAENAAQVAALVGRADEAARVGRDLGAGSAFDFLNQARAIAPDDAGVRERYQALLARLLRPGNDALARGDPAAALVLVRETEAVLANEPAWQLLKSKADDAARLAAQRTRVAQVLSMLDAQVRAGRLDAPAGDNAQETLAQARALAPDDSAVALRQDALAQALLQRGQASLGAGRAEAALSDANAALSVQPGLAAAQDLKRRIEGQLSADRARVLEGLAAAQQALAEGRYLVPAERSARALLEGVRRLDPGNAEAAAMLAGLPQRIAESIAARVAAGDLSGAESLLAEAQRAYPGNAAIAAVAGPVAAGAADARARAQRNQEFARITQLIAARPLRPEATGDAARAIARLLQANPRDLDAATQRQRLVSALAEAVAGADSAAEIDAVARALAPAREALVTDPALARVGADLDAARVRVAEAEQARLGASRGVLVIDAAPWATVQSVVDAQRRPVALPADATTPIRLELPAGAYTITFAHPGARRPVVQVAQVQAQRSATALASFAGSISAQEYLRRAGF